ncbi:MAG: peptidylprolyl isomerase [Anaerolineaceae bacterium]|nr:MAG: peptidylprolyl isomerase [Anaerolineaceae bacterium]
MQLAEWHPGDIRTVYRHFPLLSIHDKASLAGQAAEAAGAQGLFWEMHDFLFGQYSAWIRLSPEEFLQWLAIAAEELELDVQRFEDDLVRGQYAIEMEDAFFQGIASGILATPFIFLNGSLYQVEPSLTNLESYIRLNLLTASQYDRYPPMILEEDTQYLARIELESGEVIVQLYPDHTPLAVNNFIFLAKEGWFDGNPFHTIVPGVYVESGDPTGTGLGGPGYYFDDEISDDLTFNEPGMLAMSSSGPNTNGSQFFITLKPLPELNGSRTIFGRLIDGLDLLTSLNARQPLEDFLKPHEVVILSVTIEVR